MKKGKDNAQLFREYQNKWLALADDDKFISAGSTLDEVLQEAKRKGFDNPVTTKVPDFGREFIL